MDRQERKALFERVDIYPVTCQRLSAGRTDPEVVDGIIRGGARIVQLREKEFSAREIYRLAVELRKKTAEAGVLLIINNHVDIALAVDADGVHLGRDDLPVEAARKHAPELLIGASTHSVAEALQARDEGADYINIGPIFPTRTKEGVHSFLGPEAIPEISSRVQLPFTVMGGIKAGNMEQVLQKGARRIAMVTEITAAPDIAETVRSLRKKIHSWSAV